MMQQKRILIVDDEERIRQIIQSLLEKHDYTVGLAEDGKQALKHVDAFAPHVVLLDMKMPELDGRQVLTELEKRHYSGKIIVITAYGSIDEAVDTVKAGAFDYVTKPFVSQDLLNKIDRAFNQIQLENELQRTRELLHPKSSFSGIVGHSRQMQKLFDLTKRVAASTVPVLITGESGTGKEMFARAIHLNSSRKEKEYLALHAGALPESLIESELFGHKKGSFSGAHSDRPGLLAKADGGTLFLDEISEMPTALQARLLRFTQSGEYLPLGERSVKKADVRLIAASNRDIEQLVATGEFREDLYYRLNVVRLQIPPLRERKEDILPLTSHFLSVHGGTGRPERSISPQLRQALLEHVWPGNVRELENLVRSMLALSGSDELDVDDLPATLMQNNPSITSPGDKGQHTLESGRNAGEKKALLAALDESDGNRTHAARKLGISRVTLLKKIKKHGLD